jgi:hypothetical protein
MKAYRRIQIVASLIPNLDTKWRWVVNFSPQPLYLRENTPVPTEQEAGWDTEPF